MLFTTIAISEKTIYKEKIIIPFSQPEIRTIDDKILVELRETEDLLIKKDSPMLPMYTKTFSFPRYTNIKEVTVERENIKEIYLDKEIKQSPKIGRVGSSYSEKTVKNFNEPYPTDFYDYNIGFGISKTGEKSIILSVNLYPIKYFPTEDKIQYISNMNIIIDYEESSFQESYDENFDLLVISKPSFTQELNRLVTHKNSNDIDTRLVNLDEIYQGIYFPVQGEDAAEKIKFFIKNAYDNWNIKYVLLVGGDDELPTRKTHLYISEDDYERFVSDLYYADLYDEKMVFQSWDTNDNGRYCEYKWGTPPKSDEMDFYPDVMIGRLACTDIGQVSTCVDKIISYEQNEAFKQDWFNHIVLCGGDSFPDDEEKINEGEFVNSRIIDLMSSFSFSKLWVSNGKLGSVFPTGVKNIENEIEEGCGFIDFSGHGSHNLWSTHPHKNKIIWLPTPFGGFYSNDISNLENGDMLPIVITGACSVGKYDKNDDCFSWSWLPNPDGGGIASFGATALGYAYLGSSVIDGLIEGISIDTINTYNDNALNPGEMWLWAINNYIDNGLNYPHDIKTICEWTLFGDPTLSIREPSERPFKPDPPAGPASGETGNIYTYSAVSSDPDEDQISYRFDWDDGTFSDWIGPVDSGTQVSADKTWDGKGNYQIRVIAKDIHGTFSEWSEPTEVQMAYNPGSNPSNLKPGTLFTRWSGDDGFHLPLLLGDMIIFIQRDLVVKYDKENIDSAEFILYDNSEKEVDRGYDTIDTNGIFSYNFNRPGVGFYIVKINGYEEDELVSSIVFEDILSISI